MQTDALSVLLIDDDEVSCNIFKMILDHHQLPLAVVNNAAQGLDYLRNNHPDIVVIDIFLPDQDGYATLDTIRKQGLADHAALVATTSYYTSDTNLQVYARGFTGYLPKPFNSDALVPYLREIAQRRAS